MRRANLLTLRKFFNWKSTWCSKFFYRSLLYKDLFIQFYLNSLFFKLRFNTSSIKLNYLNTNIVICTFDIYVNSLKRLKRYNNSFLKRIANMYNYILIYLNTVKNNKLLINKTHNDSDSNTINLFKLKSFYLNFFFSIFSLKKKSKYLFNKNTIRNPFFINSNYRSILYNNNIFFSYNEVLNLENLHNILKLDIQVLNCIKLEYYYKTINSMNLIFFFNFNKNWLINESICILPYFYLKSKSFFFFYKKNSSLNALLYVISNLNFYYRSLLNNLHMFNNIMYNLFFKNINFNYKFLNKIDSNFISSAKNSILQLSNLKNLTNYKKNIMPKKLNFYKIKSSFFFFINPKLVENFNIIKPLLYLKKKNIFNLNKITKFLKKLYFKVDIYKRTNNYLFIYWLIKKIWFNLFNKIYITYIYKTIKYKTFFKYKLINLIINFFGLTTKYFYLFNFNKLYIYSLNFMKNINFLMKLKKFILVLKFDLKKIKQYFKYIYITSYFNTLFMLTEKTLLMYNNKNINYVLLPNIFLFIKPFISSAKLVCDYLYFKLKKKLTISTVYNKIRKWQLAERSAVATSFKIKKKIRYYVNYNRLKKSTFQNQLFKNTFFRESLEFRAPLRGIRCICSGPPYKAKRKLRNFYHIWVANFNLTGWMPLQQLKYQIDYYQTFIVLKRSTIGLKVWILLESYVVLK